MHLTNAITGGTAYTIREVRRVLPARFIRGWVISTGRRRSMPWWRPYGKMMTTWIVAMPGDQVPVYTRLRIMAGRMWLIKLWISIVSPVGGTGSIARGATTLWEQWEWNGIPESHHVWGCERLVL